MTTIIEAAYEGSTAVRIDGRLHSYTPQQARGGVLPKAARRLIKEGADPAALLRVTRNGTPVFAADATLGWWAGITFEEPDNAPRSIRRRAYRPHSSEREVLTSGGLGAPERSHTPPLVQPHL